ncbi:glycosyl transferase family 1 [Marinimicrobium koreense]|uniref:Glycosyl transferase family 1 n=1 Tax=Marinimicrobium koreense TaxID=306545 RepID=A0A3N1NV58_9GAMM|nr:glycosyltransferase family 4 protein [Marinimicrobium koreense]ROQ20043.1 glycosyl transferase family 1 [Marinimicrobium koreense]
MNLVERANKSLRSGRIDEARVLYAEAVQAYPEIAATLQYNMRSSGMVAKYRFDDQVLSNLTASSYVYEDSMVRHYLKWLESLEFCSHEDFCTRYESNERKTLKVLVGTLYSGENEIEECKRSVKRQSYPAVLMDHVVIEYLPKKEAMDTLYRTFLDSEYDVLVKLDADMVLVDREFVDKVVRLFKHNDSVSLLQCSLTDFYSGGEMQGINVYDKDMIWETSSQDNLFTDKTKTPKRNRKIEWSKFTRSVFHSPNPSGFQAFHFGVHRAIKVREAALAGSVDRAEEQLMYIERTFRHYEVRKDIRLLYSVLGAELAMHGHFDVEHLNYTDPHLETFFVNEIEAFGRQKLELRLRLLRVADTPFVSLNDIRRNRDGVGASFDVATVLLIVPHAGIYGGINRFLEIGKSLSEKGILATVGVRSLDKDSVEYKKMRDSFPEVNVSLLDECVGAEWDLAVCGDFSSGVLLALGEVKAKVTAAYLLNGWQHRERNIKQIELVKPDVIFANSSYAERCYEDLCPTPAQGAVDFSLFNSSGRVQRRHSDPLKIVVPGGRLKPRKRVKDAVKAVNNLVRMGCSVELHVFNAENASIDCLAKTKVWVALNREEVAKLMKSSHVVLCPEEDAGWNNPAAEALACGIPLVCTQAGTTDFAEHGVTAFVVPARDVDAITSSLKYIYDHPERSYEMAHEGVSRVRQFTWSSVTEKILHAVEKCRPADAKKIDEKRMRFLKKIRKTFDSLV